MSPYLVVASIIPIGTSVTQGVGIDVGSRRGNFLIAQPGYFGKYFEAQRPVFCVFFATSFDLALRAAFGLCSWPYPLAWH